MVTATASVPIGVQLYSLREPATADLPAVLERLDRIGFEGVELAGFYGQSVADVQRALGRTQLRVAAAHVGLADDDVFKAALDDHAELGCDTVVIPSAPHPASATATRCAGPPTW